MVDLRAMVTALITVPLLASCSVVDVAAPSGSTDCVDAVPRAGDLNDRTRMAPNRCPVGSEAEQEAAGTGVAGPIVADPVAPTAPSASASAPRAPSASATPRAASTPSPSSSVPPASLRVGQKSSAGGGSYVLWLRAENHVYLVHKGIVTRVMPTTALSWKTPPGTYKVKYKVAESASLDGKRTWALPYFVAFWRRPGADGDIAFHEVPHDRHSRRAQPLDTVGENGRVSDGCARMRPADAKAIWAFTRVGTQVVVR